MNISIIGTGYVGLVTGLGLAELGNVVTCVDIDNKRIATLNGGKAPFYEEGLGALLSSNLQAGRLSFTTDVIQAVRTSSIIFVAVGTPSKQSGKADLSQVIQVAESIAECIADYNVIVLKSTVPVGTVEVICNILKQHIHEGKDFDIVVNPEFLREGKAIYDFFHPARIIIGSRSRKAIELMRQLYTPFLLPNVTEAILQSNALRPGTNIPFIETDIASAQMIKYASNAFLATRISFINEIASICERLGANVKEGANGMGYDTRIGHEYLEAGIGFGGACLEKDLTALMKLGEDYGYEPALLKAVLEKNEYRVRLLISKLKELTGSLLYQKTIAVFGLAFKTGTSDVRNSVSLRVISQLEKEGAKIKAHDPVAIEEAKKIKPTIQYYDDPYDTTDNAEALLILSNWPQYQELDFKYIKTRMKSPNIVDGRNILDPREMLGLGFKYRGIGI